MAFYHVRQLHAFLWMTGGSNYCKTEFGNAGVEFLRHVVREGHVMLVASVVKAISKIGIPTHQ